MIEIPDTKYFQPLLIARTEGLETPVHFVERQTVVKNSVLCDVYEVNGEKDLAIIHIAPSTQERVSATPAQRVEQENTITIEESVIGYGALVVKRKDMAPQVYSTENGPIRITVAPGDIMQWQNKSDLAELTVFEVCYPPFANGRYYDLTEEETAQLGEPFVTVPQELIVSAE